MKDAFVATGENGVLSSFFTIDIGVDGLRFPAIEVVGDEQGKEIVLGRNFLNKLNLLLRDPAHLVDLLDR